MEKELFKTPYGSHLYGTSTPQSDFDYKVVYLPPLEEVMLGFNPPTYKVRTDKDGNPVANNAVMPEGGVETEYVPLQTFCYDFLNGQTYAFEVAFAACQNKTAPDWMLELVEKFTTCNVASMAGFAMKQTFDYVHRGLRLAAAEKVLDVLAHWSATLDDLENADPGSYMKKRLDSVLPDGRKVLYAVAEDAGLPLGTTVNNNRTMETLKLNGREYLETTDLHQLELAVTKLVKSYGVRSNSAKENEVDLKSLSHAVRVYEQAVELLTVGYISFPRPNAEYLLNVKRGNLDLEDVKARLLELEAQIMQLESGTKLLPAKTPEMQHAFNKWMFELLVKQYKLLGVSWSL